MKKPFFGLIIASIFILNACGSQSEETPDIPHPPVEVLNLSEKPSYQVSEIGQIKAVKEIELIAKATGTIGAPTVHVGEPVSEGQVIAVIDFDESNNPAKVNYENAQLQLNTAQKNYNQLRALDQDTVTRARLRVQTLETTLGRLQRNLEELLSTNDSTKTTLMLQVENAEKNLDTAEINYDNLVAQFDQSWDNLLVSTKTSLDGIMVNLESNLAQIEDFINPNNRQSITPSDWNNSFGARDSRQRLDTANAYNAYASKLELDQVKYKSYGPLTDTTVETAIDLVKGLTDSFRDLLSMVRTMLNNSIASTQLTQVTLDGYKSLVSGVESATIADSSLLNTLKQNLQNFKLDRTRQIATADNNRIIANNQFSEATNALLQFQTSSVGAVQDLQVQIEQTQNDLLSAQADLNSALRSYGISSSSQELEISTLENQLRLAEKGLTDNEVRSTIDGVLSEFVVDEGDYVTSGTFLGKVIQHEQVKVVFHLSRENAERLQLGQPFSFTIDGDGEERLGIISKISPSADPASKKILVEGAINNEQYLLRPETYINLSLDLSNETFDPGKIYVPMNSIIFTQNTQYVYVVEEAMAQRRDVEIGSVFGAWVEITDGLTKQDLLIVDGHRNLPPSGNVQVDVIQ